MNNQLDKREEIGEGTLLDDSIQGFQLTNPMGNGSIEVLATKDEKGDYPVMSFCFQNGEQTVKFALKRDELAAITFALARQDQQSKLLDTHFKEYVERPVRLMIEAKKDIKKGDFVVCWRKERVPKGYEYTRL